MVTGSIAIVGEPFKEYVSDQITKRQEILGAGISETLRTPQQIQYINGSNSWLKLASSVKIEGEKGKEKLTEIFSESDADFLLGTELAKRYVLFNGTSTFNVPNERQGVLKNSNLQINSSVYGTGGIEFGLQAMPGLQSFTVSNANRGSIRQGEITIRANSEQQFNILELLYVRLGFTMLIEWGNGMYYDNEGEFQKMGSTLIDDGSWFDENGITHLQFFDKIEKKRKEYNGNYDAFFCKVTNFNWTFNEDGYYEITLSLISLGDVVESFKINTLYNDTLIKKEQNETDVSEINQDSISNFLYCLKLEKEGEDQEAKDVNIEENNSDVVSALSFNLKMQLKQPYNNKTTAEDLYFIRFGYLNFWLENNVIDHNKNGNSKPFPVFNISNSDQMYMQIFPGLVSTNPSICYIKNRLPVYNNETIGNVESNYNSTLYFREIYTQTNDKVGIINNIYLNFNFITNTLKELKDSNTGEVDFFSFYKRLCDGINSCFGGYINLKVILSEDNIIEIIDDNLPSRIGRDAQIIEETSPTLNLYGIDSDTKQSNFVRGFNFSTQITNDLATTISIGATAANQSTNKLSDFFSSLNRGLVDRYQQERFDGNPEKPEDIKIKCATETEKKPSTLEIIWSDIKNGIYDILKEIGNIAKDTIDFFALNENLTKQELYLEYLVRMFGSKSSKKSPRYFLQRTSDINEGSTVLNSFLTDFFKSVNQATERESASSMIGFIPIEIDITVKGISGLKIYNQLKLDTRFLPRNYPKTIDFVIIGLEHTIQDNDWVTKIKALSKPGKNVTSAVLAVQTATQSELPFEAGQTDEFNQSISFYPPTNNPITENSIRVDEGGSGFFGASREGGSRPHDGIDLSTTVGQPIFSPITGKVKSTQVKSGLPAVEIVGTGEYSGYSVRILYVELVTNRVPNNGRVEKGTFYFRAVDLSGAYPENVTDHIHFEVYKGRQKLNPIQLKYSFDT